MPAIPGAYGSTVRFHMHMDSGAGLPDGRTIDVSPFRKFAVSKTHPHPSAVDNHRIHPPPIRCAGRGILFLRGKETT